VKADNQVFGECPQETGLLDPRLPATTIIPDFLYFAFSGDMLGTVTLLHCTEQDNYNNMRFAD